MSLTRKLLLAMQEALTARTAGEGPAWEFGEDNEYTKLWDAGYYQKAEEWVAEQLALRERRRKVNSTSASSAGTPPASR